MPMPRKKPKNFRRRYEVVVCENYREAREKYHQDILANTPSGEIDSARISELMLDFHNGTVRRYFGAGQGPEMVMGLEIDAYHNLIRDEEEYWQWEDFLRVRVDRSAIWREDRERRAREEMSTWALIVEEWRVFLSRPVGRFLTILAVVLVIFSLWVLSLGGSP